MRNTKIMILGNPKKKIYRIFSRGMAVLLLAGQIFGGQLPLFHAVSQAAVILNEQGTVAVKELKVKKEAGGAKNLKTTQGNAICLKKGKKIKVKKKIALEGISWYKIKFRYEKEIYRGYVKKKQILLSLQETEKPEEKKGLVTATSLNVRTTAGIGDNILEYQETGVALVKGTEVTVLSEDDSAGSVWYQVSFFYDGEKLKGYVSGKYIRLEEDNETASSLEQEEAETASEKEETESGKEESETEEIRVLTEAELEDAMIQQNFPESYKPYLRELHRLHPAWTFEAYHTGLSWQDVIKKQSKVGRNLVPVSKNIAWKSMEEGAYDWTSDTFVVFDGTTWVSASKNAVEYYMDPRNFLDETGIYQFELLNYNNDFQSRKGVLSILRNTPMEEESSYQYTNPDTGNIESITYADTFIKAAEVSGVSPYHLSSRVRQEVVTGTDSFSASAAGTYSGYEGYYNFYNIGASDSAGGGAIAKGLAWAKKTDDTYLLPWTSPYRSILGGALYIGKSYINKGQNTLYLEKFNVTPVSTYNHQYMTNVEGAYSEAKKTSVAYANMENVPVIFSIPVYEDMPETACAMPKDEKNPNNLLKSLNIKSYSLTPTFQPEDEPGMEYNLIVDNCVESIKINASPASLLSTVSGTGKQALKEGDNTFSVEVTAENGEVREYIIHVVRKEK